MQRIMYVLNILHYQLCYTSGLHHNLTILLSASLSNLQRIRRNFSGEDVTASKALVCRTPQARHAPPTQDDGHPMPPVSPVCHRRPVIAVSTSSSFSAGSSLRAPSVAGDLPPPQRPTRFSQPPATLLPANRGGQADSPMARPARRSAAPRQQHQPGLRAAASSSAEHGESRRPIFVHRPGHTVPRLPRAP